MTAAVLVLAIALAAIAIASACVWWQNDAPRPSDARPPASPTTTAPARFAGRGLAAAPPRPQRRPHNPPRRRPTTTRFSGRVHASPNAIGLACGRPVRECTRGANCLCLD